MSDHSPVYAPFFNISTGTPLMGTVAGHQYVQRYIDFPASNIEAITAAAWQFGRDDSNNLRANVPTAQQHSWGVNGTVLQSLTAVQANFFQGVTLTTGGSNNAVLIANSHGAEPFTHRSLAITPSQVGANAASLIGGYVLMTKATAATTLGAMIGVLIDAPTIIGTVSASDGIRINDQTNGGISAGGASAMQIIGTGTSNAVVWGASARQYANGINNVRIVDATNASGLDINVSTTNATLNTVLNGNASLIFQNNTFTPGVDYSSVQIVPTFASENFVHRALAITPVQNGANTQALTGITITMNKAIGATTLASMYGIAILSPSITGTVSSNRAIFINDQSNAGITTPRGIEFFSTGVANSIVWGSAGVIQYANSAGNMRFADTTNASGLDCTITATDATINTIQATTARIFLQNQTLTPGFASGAVVISPTYASENFTHRGLDITVTQNGANTSSLVGSQISIIKATGATTLTTALGLTIASPTITGTITNMSGIRLNDMSVAGVGTNSFGIEILAQGVVATTTRAIEIAGGGVNNAIRLRSATNVYANASDNFRISESTNVGGLDFNLTTTNVNVLTLSVGNASLIFQNQAFTPGATHASVSVQPTYAAENFQHTAFQVLVTQNGANTNTLQAISTAWSKATAVTTLDTARALEIGAPSIVAGTVTTGQGINIEDQSLAGMTTSIGIRIASQTANATTTRAMDLVGTGLNNAIRFGASANVYGSGAQTVRFSDSTDVGGLDIVTSTTNISLRQRLTGSAVSINLVDQTFTPGATHSVVQIAPTWASENFQHNSVVIGPTQNGTNTNAMRGLLVQMTKATAATTLTTMVGVFFDVPVVTGTVTNSFAIDIADQTNAGITTPRAMRTATTGVANAFVWGGSALQYANAVNNIRFMNDTNARGIDFNLTAAGDQTIAPITGNLNLLSDANAQVVLRPGGGAVDVMTINHTSTTGHALIIQNRTNTANEIVNINNTANALAGSGLNVQGIDHTVAGTQSFGVAASINRTQVDPTGDTANFYCRYGTFGTGVGGTITNLNAILCDNPTYAAGFTATRAAFVRFSAAAGTHKYLPAAVDSSTGGTNAVLTINKMFVGAVARTAQVLAYIQVDINGTLGYVPVLDVKA